MPACEDCPTLRSLSVAESHFQRQNGDGSSYGALAKIAGIRDLISEIAGEEQCIGRQLTEQAKQLVCPLDNAVERTQGMIDKLSTQSNVGIPFGGENTTHAPSSIKGPLGFQQPN